MKTVEEITAYIRMEIAEAKELLAKYRGKDHRQAVFYFSKIEILTHLLEEINAD